MPKNSSMTATVYHMENARCFGSIVSLSVPVPRQIAWAGGRKDEALDRVGKAFLLVGGRHVRGFSPQLGAGTRPPHAQPALGEHEHVVGLVAHRGDLLGWNAHGIGHPRDH